MKIIKKIPSLGKLKFPFKFNLNLFLIACSICLFALGNRVQIRNLVAKISTNKHTCQPLPLNSVALNADVFDLEKTTAVISLK